MDGIIRLLSYGAVSLSCRIVALLVKQTSFARKKVFYYIFAA